MLLFYIVSLQCFENKMILCLFSKYCLLYIFKKVQKSSRFSLYHSVFIDLKLLNTENLQRS